MTTTIDARLYYATETSAPILVEVWNNHVCEVGEGGWRPLAHYPGKWVQLAPVPDIAPALDDETQWRLGDLERRMDEQQGEL